MNGRTISEGFLGALVNGRTISEGLLGAPVDAWVLEQPVFDVTCNTAHTYRQWHESNAETV
jgi:hypothetical protein